MKKVLFLFLLLMVSTPVFSTPGWYEGANDNVQFYDDSEYQNYAKELEDKFHAKYCKRVVDKDGVTGTSCTYPENGYDKEVTSPLYDFRIQQCRNGKIKQMLKR